MAIRLLGMCVIIMVIAVGINNRQVEAFSEQVIQQGAVGDDVIELQAVEVSALRISVRDDYIRKVNRIYPVVRFVCSMHYKIVFINFTNNFVGFF